MNRARRACSHALGILLGISGIVIALSCSPPGPEYLCFDETGRLFLGRCPTVCESQCNLAKAAGCAAKDCAEQCKAREEAQTPACRDARYLQWRCLRRAGSANPECRDGKVVFLVAQGLCVEEGTEVETLCRVADAADGDAADGDATDGHVTDSDTTGRDATTSEAADSDATGL